MLISDPEIKPQVVVFPKKRKKLAHLRQYYGIYLIILMVFCLGLCFLLVALHQQQENQLLEKVNTQKEKLTLAISNSKSKQSENESDNAIPLKKGDKVLFVGDSMMKEIAPYGQEWLKSEYQLDSINLSEKNASLAQSKPFNLPMIIEQTLQQDKSLKLIVILLGVNDSWNLTDSVQDRNQFIFQQPAWEKEYLLNVNRIVRAAEQADAKIIWLGIPHVKSEILNMQMDYLDGLLANHLSSKENVLWLKISDLLSDGANEYQDSIILNHQPVIIRTEDGIHFTESGQQFMADYIASYIAFKHSSF